MSYELDPEVLADLQLRESTVRERGNRRSAPMPSWSPPAIVGQWPCKVCKRPVDVPDAAMERFEAFSAALVRRGEQPLDEKRILFCDECRNEYIRTAPDRRRGQVERMRPVIVQLKNSRNPEQEWAAIKQLEEWRHPDVPGLVQSIRARIDAKSSKAPKGGL